MGLFGSNDKLVSEVDPSSPNRDWQLVAELAHTSFKEQRRARRWGTVFKLLTFVYLFFVLILFVVRMSGDEQAAGPHTAVVPIKGKITADSEANANQIVSGLRAAFESEQAKAVILAINSPGGSPVQAGYVYDEIKRLRGLHPDKKVYAVISDLGASGAYYIAAAADEIYADKASLVGSIGVTASSFGFVDTMEKLGVERRHFTSGEHKAFLDPFSPVKEDEQLFWQEVLRSTHQQFIKAVKDGRGDRLKGDPSELYSGLIWNGEQALELGLVDALGSAGFVAREIVGQEEVVVYGRKKDLIEELSKALGLSIGEGVVNSVQAQDYPLMY